MVEGVTPQVLANCHCRNSWGLIALQARNQAGTIWIWNERQNRLCKRADARLGNDVARKRLACLGIVNGDLDAVRVYKAAKITILHGRCRHRSDGLLRLVLGESI